MIKRVRIQDFRSCRDVTLENVPSFVALIGRNGAGKTNILRALDWFARVATRAEYVVESMEIPKITRIEMDVEVDDRLYSYTFERRYHASQQQNEFRLELDLTETVLVHDQHRTTTILERRGQEVRSSLRQGVVAIGPAIGSLAGLMSVLPATDELVEMIRPLFSFLSSVRYYPIDEPYNREAHAGLNDWIPVKTYQDWLAQYTETKNPGESATLRIVHMWLTDRAKFNQLVEWLGPQGLDLITAIHVTQWPPPQEQKAGEQAPPQMSFYALAFQPSQCNVGEVQAFGYGSLSTGTRRTIKLLVSLLFDSSEVMLLEHPEDGVHSALVKLLIDLLKTNLGQTQVIMTSHSLTVLNELAPEQIRLVMMEACQTTVRALKPKERKAAREFMAKKGTFAEFVELVEASEIAK